MASDVVWAALVGSLPPSIIAGMGLWQSRKNDRHIGDVHHEVKAGNGITMAALADRQEGRRVQADIPEAERTDSEQGYVDNLEAGGRDPGHDGNPSLPLPPEGGTA